MMHYPIWSEKHAFGLNGVQNDDQNGIRVVHWSIQSALRDELCDAVRR